MTHKEYIELFHRAQVNLVAFKPIIECDEELKAMVELAVAEAREKYMDALIKHPAIVRQIIDAGLLASNPAGLRKREKNEMP